VELGHFYLEGENGLDAFQNHMPEMLTVSQPMRQAKYTRRNTWPLKPFIPSVPIFPLTLGDGKSQQCICYSLAVWLERPGTWNSAWENMEKDYFENAVAGESDCV
jgi:mannose-1-phosphate guanylyltransferase